MMRASPALRDVLALSRGDDWVDFALFIEATELVDSVLGRGDNGLAREIGRFSATHGVGVWKGLLMRRISPSLLLSVASGVWSHHYDGGRLASRANGPNGLIVRLESFPQPHITHCASIAGWMQGSLELNPKRRVDVREVACRTRGALACEFNLAWTEV
jgi:hypothetical protein